MEITTIIGIVFAVIMILLGLFWLLKKPNDTAPSLESALQLNEESQQPIIPRHVRDQLQVDCIESQRIEPVLNEPPADHAVVHESVSLDQAQIDLNHQQTVSTLVQADSVAEDSARETQRLTAESILVANPLEQKPSEQGFSLNNHINKAEIAEFNEESSILDAHLHEQKVVDDECALVTAESFIAFNIVSNHRVLSGDKTLKVLLKYGLRFGEMKCFHRYNDDGSKLLFSVLKITEEGTEGFDLETLSTEEVKGLACFLALPHNDVQNAFDTMVSISGLIAREISGAVYDQDNFELTPQLREYWRHQAIDYKSGKTLGV
ncbi:MULTISPECIES: cell division protein ZipA C-terminal FtsZ-binding domain-containing protein [unclassified Acinetobacter]|uniref:cell division protein ZipA C-terminal FtsZ-binding domain-containing protein n=1 Tax=unclassified Acinetobacter TaxID=196816 RepID=UPI002934AF67|nr:MULTISPECIES: cell division protein ZipA C-terminal FtsZ-binding domain-containing protein [unclassified Acinetobacter]WOE30332.1 cell division protein ZipA C-terminal FtsZ-binding domain-containing protein [Acinetobacter sp. SAAs470]WOE38523.1 cell division protein ZipA C-terminal FtsZ-binding domain-containing protein [Acinetobacter sp. SAAs474]